MRVLPNPPLKDDEHIVSHAGLLLTNTVLRASAGVLLLGVLLLAGAVVYLSNLAVYRRPLIVAVDNFGRYEAVTGAFKESMPSESVMQYFVSDFLQGYYGRNHATIDKTFFRSLAYLSDQLGAEANRELQQTQWLSKWQNSTEDNVDITVLNVILEHPETPSGLWKATAPAFKVFSSINGVETKRTPTVYTLWFKVNPLAAEKNHNLIPINPLGFTVVQIHENEAIHTADKQ